MYEGKVLTYLGILIALNTAFWNRICNDPWAFVLFNLISIFVCVALSHIEKKLLYSNHKWLDMIAYIFTKNDFNYFVKEKIIEYRIESEHCAKYKLSANICVLRQEDNFHYNGRYVWNQEEPIEVILNDPNQFRYTTSENLKWSNIDIFPTTSIPKAKSEYSIGFVLKNLFIVKLTKQSFLSCKVIEKINHLKLVAYVDPQLHPSSKATLEIQKYLGIKISEEEVTYDEALHTYSKTLNYPRKGRKYIIHWKYENGN